MFRRLFLLELVVAMLTLPAFAVDIPAGTAALCNYETLHTYEDGASVQLKAVWKANEYTVTYDSGEHATITGTAYTDTATYDENYTVPAAALDAIVPREGYTFVGFNTESGQSVANFPDAQATPWKRTGDLTVYAAYLANGTNISYNCGKALVNQAVTGTWIGETGANTAMVEYDETYGHPIGDASCQLVGYNFDGWHCVTGTTAMVSGGTTHETDGIVDGKWKWKTSNVTCTAVWTPKTYSCGAGSYLKNSSDGADCAVCPKDSYCPGFRNHTYTESDYGSKECPDGYITAEGVPAGSNKECYVQSTESCANVNAYTYGHGTAEYANAEVTCKRYFGSESVCVVAEADKSVCNIDHMECEAGYEEREVEGALRCVKKSVECPAGTYLPANSGDSDACAVCPKDSYCSGGSYEALKSSDQGKNECSGKLKSPAGARSEDDCGVILHVDGDVVYLHRDKGDRPSLVVDINGTKWYADMTSIDQGAKPMYSDTERTWHVMVGDKEYTIHSPIYE